MHISFVVAVAENGVIGVQGQLPWRLSSDMKTFRRITLGKPVIMGRKTFQSLKKPLDQRDNIVLTQDPFFEASGITTVDNVQNALTLARTLALTRGVDEIMIIGGAEIFRATLPNATRMYWTEIHATPEGDVVFPEFDLAAWQEVSREPLTRGPKDDVHATFKILERRGAA